MSDDDYPTTEELRVVQRSKVREEAERARDADDKAEERTHGRRADKAEYLAEKLAKQKEALDE